MKTMLYMVSVFLVHLLLIGCAKSDPEVRVSNRNDEPVSITIEPDHGNNNVLMFTDVKPHATTDYVSMPPATGGTVSASTSGTTPDAIRYSALAGSSYRITVSSGEKPVLTWEKE